MTPHFTWLHYATLPNVADENDISCITLDDPPEGTETLPALGLAFECARTALCSNIGIVALQDSFVDIVTKNDIVDALSNINVYVCKWLRNARDAFHIPVDKKPANISAGNVFLKYDDVHYLLPNGEASTWTAKERQRVVLVSWFLLHEMSHAIGSILAESGTIAQAETPPKATGFRKDGQINVKYISWARNGTVLGERGWFLEDKLGGKVSIYEPENKLIITRPELGKYYYFTDDMVDAYLSNDAASHDTLFPLALEGQGQELTPYVEAHTKGRQAALPSVRPPADIIKY